MGIEKGKFYDARLTREYCDYLKNSTVKYCGFANGLHGSDGTFCENELFHGNTATEFKRFIKQGADIMLKEVTDVHDQMVKDQNYVITMFESMVDPAKDARIEYDTLEIINKDFNGLYTKFNEEARAVERIVNNLSSEFGSYAHFPQPNSGDAIDGFIDICGGEFGTGFFKECQNKLLSFDVAMRAYIKGKDTVTRKNKLSNGIKKTTGVFNSFAPSQAVVPEQTVKKILNVLKKPGFIRAGAFMDMLEKAKNDGKTALKCAGTLSYILATRQGKFFIEKGKELFSDLKEDVWKDIKGIIPRYLPNGDFIEIYEYLRKTKEGSQPFWNRNIAYRFRNTMTQEEIDAHYEHNAKELASGNVYKPGKYIENQYAWSNVYYGKDESNMAYSGCEIIAVANVLHRNGTDLDADGMAELIKGIEEDGMAYDGKIGTSPMALQDYLVDKGYDVDYTLSNDSNEISAIEGNYDTYIVTAYNEKDDITAMVHTVCITQEKNGDFVIHNGGTDGGTDGASRPYSSLEEAIHDIGGNGNSESIMVMGVEAPVIVDGETGDEKAC